jgi:cytidylate kinase
MSGKKKLTIAIDGPAASGKSTVARRVAAELGLLYVDSGAVYRGVTLQMLRWGVDTTDAEAMAHAAERLRLDAVKDGGAVKVRVEGEAPGEALRSHEVNEHVSPVAAVPAVRRLVTQTLRDMARLGGLVMEGRDIGTAVFPDADFKFYLDASEAERARRRHAERQAAAGSVEDVGASLLRRDRIDSTRRTAPLRAAADAVTLDTTCLSVDAVCREIVARIDKA